MKKALIIAGVVVFLLVGAGAAYYYFFYEPPKPERTTRVRAIEVVEPTKYSLRNETFVVPGEDDQVVLSLVSPTATRDYPMGRFTLLGTTTKEGQLIALDFFTTELENGLRAVPISVTYQGEAPLYYLAILSDDGTTRRHTSSILLGPSIQITDVTRSGNQVSVTYQAHTLDQNPVIDLPAVTTTAIIDIGNSTVVQEGRKPWQETIEVVKVFTGIYNWIETTGGDDLVTPPSVGQFTLRFDANRITLETDCNTGGAVYVPPTGSSTSLTFTEFTQTTRFCESQLETPYFDMIKAVSEYAEPDANTLEFTLSDGRVMTFQKPGATPPLATEEVATPDEE